MGSYTLLQISLLLGLANVALGKQLPCVANEIPIPEYFGTKVTSLTVNEVHEYQDWEWSALANIPFEHNPIDFCNVTVTYTHPGLNDNVNVYVWLPLENWNGNFLAQGGGGWAAGIEGQYIRQVSVRSALIIILAKALSLHPCPSDTLVRTRMLDTQSSET